MTYYTHRPSLPTVLFLVLAASGCTSDRENSVQIKIGDAQLIDGKPIPSIAPGCYWQLQVVDHLLVLSDECNYKFFYFYNPETYESLFAAGEEGRGPNDFAKPLFLARSDQDEMVVSESQGLLKQISLDEKELTVTNTYPLKAGGGSRDIYQIKDRFYGKNTNKGNGIIFIDRPSTKGADQLQWIPMPASIQIKSKEQEFKQKLSDNFFTVSSKNNTIVSGMRFFNAIFFLDLDGNVKKEMTIDDGHLRDPGELIDFSIHNVSPGSFIYTGEVSSTDKYVYLLWYGSRMQELSTDNGDIASKLVVFNWDGEFIKSFQLNGYINCFTVTKDDKKVIAGSLDSTGNTVISAYKLNF